MEKHFLDSDSDYVAPKREWIRTYSGEQFHFEDPKNIKIGDIAHALSNICRWTGHVNSFYSVAQHSVICSARCQRFALRALLHDAAEAYIGDINKPLKNLLGQTIIDIEHKIQDAIWLRYGLDVPTEEEARVVKSIDTAVGMMESQQLLGAKDLPCYIGVRPLYGLQIEPLCPHDAESLFLQRFKELM